MRQLANAVKDLGWHPFDLLDPRKRGSAVANPDGLLSAAAVETLSLMIAEHEKRFPLSSARGAQAAVVVVQRMLQDMNAEALRHKDAALNEELTEALATSHVLMQKVVFFLSFFPGLPPSLLDFLSISP